MFWIGVLILTLGTLVQLSAFGVLTDTRPGFEWTNGFRALPAFLIAIVLGLICLHVGRSGISAKAPFASEFRNQVFKSSLLIFGVAVIIAGGMEFGLIVSIFTDDLVRYALDLSGLTTDLNALLISIGLGGLCIYVWNQLKNDGPHLGMTP